MKNRSLYFGAGLVAAMVAEVSSASQYHSTFKFPNIDVKNRTYRFYVPYAPSPPSALRVMNVSWSWVNRRSPQPLRINLCQMATNRCIDVTNQPSGSTSAFNSYYAEFPFYFDITAYRSPFFPIRNLDGTLKVQW